MLSINWLAVGLATVVSVIAGSLWFGPKTFFPVWWRALGKPEGSEPGAGNSMAVVFGSTFVAMLVQATVLAAIFGKLGGVSVTEGGLLGCVIGVGFAAGPAVSHRLFGQQGFTVWLLESGSDILNLTLMGIIIAALS